jgi:hypothetical protein
MNEAQYPIQLVARLTGLSADVIRIPATYRRSPSTEGVERTQSPLDFAKKGTLIARSHGGRQSSLPVERSGAVRISNFFSLRFGGENTVSLKMGPE